MGLLIRLKYIYNFWCSTTRRNPICRAPFWGLVAHLWCATHIKPLVYIISGACLYAPRLCVLSVAHPNACGTHNICGAPKGGAPRIGCATDIKISAPQICFPFYFFWKKLKIEKKPIFFENHKNRNNVKKLLYFNFLRILSYEEHFQITPNFLTSR
jgi:hypothetical protein